MGLFTRIADRLILEPTRYAIPVEDKSQHFISYDNDRSKLETWIHRPDLADGQQPDAFLLKFLGTGGRAENSTVHPAEFWTPANLEIWSVNPPGYGGSSGRASLSNVSQMVDLLHEEIRFRSQGQPLFIWSNSLGSLAAFLFAIRYPVAGFVIRNPVPIREIVLSRAKRWHPSRFVERIVREVPEHLSCIENARNVSAPALFITSERDTVIPPEFQQMIIDSYAGDHQLFSMPGADHADPPEADSLPEYESKLRWLYHAGSEHWIHADGKP